MIGSDNGLGAATPCCLLVWSRLRARGMIMRERLPAGIRARLVQVYAEINGGQVYEYLQSDRRDFDEFAAVIAAVVKDAASGQSPPPSTG